MDSKNHLEEKMDRKNFKKNNTNESHSAACEQKKTLARKRIFIHYFPILLQKEIEKTRGKTARFFVPLPLSMRPKSVFQFDFKNHEKLRTDHDKT